MIDRRNQFAVLVAVVGSLLLHTVAALGLMNVPIAGGGSTLFEPAPQAATADRQPVRVYRAPDRAQLADLRESPADPARAAADDPRQQVEQIRRTSEQLLADDDPTDVLQPDQDQPIDERAVAPDQPRTAAAMAPGEAPAGEGDAALVDVTNQLINQADPSIELPRYVGLTDDVAAPAPGDEPINAGGWIEGAALARQLGPAGGGNGGNGGGGQGGARGAAGADAADAADEAIERLLQGAAAPDLLAGIDNADDSDRPGVATAGEAPDALVTAADLIALPDALNDLPEIADDAARLDDDFDYRMSVYRGPTPAGHRLGGGWFELRINPRDSLGRLPVLNKDVVFVLDVSDSIAKRWKYYSRLGLAEALSSLREGDRFNVVLFAHKLAVLSDDLLPATRQNRERARSFVHQSEVAGYTDVEKALRGLVREKVDQNRVYQVIFLSDGQPTAGTISPRQIIDVFTRANQQRAAVYAVAIGEKINLDLLGSLAYRNKGYVVRPGAWNKVTDTITALASRLEKPVLKDVAFNAAGVDARTVYPQQGRDLYLGDALAVWGRFDDDDRAVSLNLRGRSRGDRKAFAVTVPLDRAARGAADIAADWARARANHLRSEMLRLTGRQRAQLADQVQTLRRAYGLKE